MEPLSKHEKNKPTTRLGLGTVQFGLDYGVNNPDGVTPMPQVKEILEFAWKSGIRVLDTAALYGNSEAVLGQTITNNADFSIITKTPALANGLQIQERVKQVVDTFDRSLEQLKRGTIYGLLVHHADDLLSSSGEYIWEQMQIFKSKGQVKKIGVSVYTGQQIESVLNKFTIDLIQVPINVFDQRLIRSGHLEILRKLGVEIHARSVFLQGLLLMEPSKIPRYFENYRGFLLSYQRFIADYGISPIEAALGFAIGLPWVDTVVCGVNNLPQLRELLGMAKPLPWEMFSDSACEDPRLLNPALWKI